VSKRPALRSVPDAPVLELRDLSKHYTDHRALHGISLEVPRGAFFSLLGPSGCGKTTTLRLIAGFEQPTNGEVRLNGQPINHLRPYERNVSTVFQNYALFPHLTVQENIEFGSSGDAWRTPGAGCGRRSPWFSFRQGEALSLGDLGRRAAEGGAGRSLVLEPEVLLLDEPLAALDPALRKQMRGELKDLQRRVGITFLFVTHDQEEALTLSDRIAVMRQGRIEQIGTPEEIYLRPGTGLSLAFWARSTGSTAWASGQRPPGSRALRPGRFAGRRRHHRRLRVPGQLLSSGSSAHVRSQRHSEVPRPDGSFDQGESVYVCGGPATR